MATVPGTHFALFELRRLRRARTAPPLGQLRALASFRRETIDSEPYDEDSGHTSPLHL